MLDHAAVFLARAGQEAGHIDKGQDRDLESIAEADKPRGLARGVDIEAARQNHRLVGDDTYGRAFEADETGDDVLGILGLNLVEIPLVGDLVDQLFHVIGGVGIVGDQRVEAILDPRNIVEEGADGRLFKVVEGEKIDKAADLGQRLDVVFKGPIGDRGFAGMGGSAAQFLGGDDLVRHGLHYIGSGHEHIAGVLHHEDEVGDRRRIDRATGAGAHDDGNLRHHARGQDVALEHLGIARKRGHALLDSRAA